MGVRVEWDTIWRGFNAILALLSLMILVFQTAKYYRRMTVRSRLLSQALAGMMLAVVIGAWENVKQNNPVGFRTAVVTASVLWTLVAVLMTTPRGSYEYRVTNPYEVHGEES